jgi:8-oxo-dGTP diphosphatase
MMIFDGGLVPPDVAAAITVPAEELRGWAFCWPQEAADRLSPLLFRRVSACMAAQGTGTVAYLEDGRQVT